MGDGDWVLLGCGLGFALGFAERRLGGFKLPTYKDIFDAGHFSSPIQSVVYEPTKVQTPIMGNTNIRALVVNLENGLSLKCGRYISYSDYDPCHYTIIEHGELSALTSEWTEFNEAYEDFYLNWDEATDVDHTLEALVGQTITALTDYTWRTVIELADNGIIELKDDGLTFGLWTDRAEKQASKRAHLKRG